MPEGCKRGAQRTGDETLAVEAIGRHFALNMLCAVSATGQFSFTVHEDHAMAPLY
jgi:hypothetical protein